MLKTNTLIAKARLIIATKRVVGTIALLTGLLTANIVPSTAQGTSAALLTGATSYSMTPIAPIIAPADPTVPIIDGGRACIYTEIVLAAKLTATDAVHLLREAYSIKTNEQLLLQLTGAETCNADLELLHGKTIQARFTAAELTAFATAKTPFLNLSSALKAGQQIDGFRFVKTINTTPAAKTVLSPISVIEIRLWTKQQQ